MRCLVEGEPAARGERAQRAPWPWTTLSARSLPASSWDVAGRRPGQVPAASRARATPFAGQRPARYWLWQLEVAGGALHFCLQVGRRARRGQPPFTPQEGPLSVGLWCSGGPGAPRDRQLSDLRLWQKDGGTGIALKETAHTFDPLIRVLPALRFLSTMGELRRVGKQSSIDSQLIGAPSGPLFNHCSRKIPKASKPSH